MKKTSRPRLRLVVLLVLAFSFFLGPPSGFAQDARLKLNSLEKLSAKAAEVNDVTLDGATLQLASSVMKMDRDAKATQINDMIKNLKGIYVKNLKFSQPNEYSQADVDSIRVQLMAPRWNKIIENQDKRSGEINEIYFMKDGDNIAGMAILVAQPKELTVVNIVGPIDLSSLATLGGNFGIPNLSGRAQNKPAADASGGNADSGPFQAGKNGVGFPSCVYCPSPLITYDARNAKFQGEVQLQAVIESDGRVSNVKVTKSPGYGLDKSALEAVQLWRYKPALDPKGQPVSVVMAVEASFDYRAFGPGTKNNPAPAGAVR
jgi:TonB family protein